MKNWIKYLFVNFWFKYFNLVLDIECVFELFIFFLNIFMRVGDCLWIREILLFLYVCRENIILVIFLIFFMLFFKGKI